MRRLRDTFITAASLTLFLAGGTSTAARPPELTLTVHVSNQAGISAVILTRAKASTDRVFRAIGVRIVWSFPATQSYDPRCDGFSFVITLLSSELVQRLSSQGLRDDAIGSASSGAGRAFIYPERIRELEEPTRLNWGELLGRVIAHELGHLALPAGHSRIGIMTEGLDADPGMSARFTDPQARSIRALLESKAAYPEALPGCAN